MQSHAVSRLPKVHNYRHMKLCKLKEKKEVQMDPFYLETAFTEVLYMPKQLSLFCKKYYHPGYSHLDLHMSLSPFDLPDFDIEIYANDNN
jgi:hypothetical protein